MGNVFQSVLPESGLLKGCCFLSHMVWRQLLYTWLQKQEYTLECCPAFLYCLCPRFIQKMQKSWWGYMVSALLDLKDWRRGVCSTYLWKNRHINNTSLVGCIFSLFRFQSVIFVPTVFLIYDTKAFYIFFGFFADPYTPSAEEVQDPELFAENVRKVTQWLVCKCSTSFVFSSFLIYLHEFSKKNSKTAPMEYSGARVYTYSWK